MWIIEDNFLFVNEMNGWWLRVQICLFEFMWMNLYEDLFLSVVTICFFEVLSCIWLDYIGIWVYIESIGWNLNKVCVLWSLKELIIHIHAMFMNEWQ